MTPAERIEAAQQALWPIVCRVPTGDCHWISGPDDLVEEATDYCGPCAKKRLTTLRSVHPDKEFFLGCSCGSHETEGTSCCEDCGITLDYVLLNHGVASELDHFLENGVMTADGRLCDQDAYAVERILNSVAYSKRPDEIEDALRVAESAVALIDYSHDDARLSDDGCPISPRLTAS